MANIFATKNQTDGWMNQTLSELHNVTVTDRTLRYTSLLLGRQATKQHTWWFGTGAGLLLDRAEETAEV